MIPSRVTTGVPLTSNLDVTDAVDTCTSEIEVTGTPDTTRDVCDYRVGIAEGICE